MSGTSDVDPPTVVALVDDLMDRSKVSAALEVVTFVRDIAACTAADVVIVDLAKHARAIEPLRNAAPNARIVAFGSHVDAAAFDTATLDGADHVLTRSRFFHDPAAAIAAR